MSYGDLNWEDLDEVDAIAEKNKDNPLLDAEGFRKHKPISERIYRALAMIIFIIVFPFVVVFLGIYRLFSLIGSRKEKEL